MSAAADLSTAAAGVSTGNPINGPAPTVDGNASSAYLVSDLRRFLDDHKGRVELVQHKLDNMCPCHGREAMLRLQKHISDFEPIFEHHMKQQTLRGREAAAGDCAAGVRDMIDAPSSASHSSPLLHGTRSPLQKRDRRKVSANDPWAGLGEATRRTSLSPKKPNQPNGSYYGPPAGISNSVSVPTYVEQGGTTYMYSGCQCCPACGGQVPRYEVRNNAIQESGAMQQQESGFSHHLLVPGGGYSSAHLVQQGAGGTLPENFATAGPQSFYATQHGGGASMIDPAAHLAATSGAPLSIIGGGVGSTSGAVNNMVPPGPGNTSTTLLSPGDAGGGGGGGPSDTSPNRFQLTRSRVMPEHEGFETVRGDSKKIPNETWPDTTLADSMKLAGSFYHPTTGTTPAQMRAKNIALRRRVVL